MFLQEVEKPIPVLGFAWKWQDGRMLLMCFTLLLINLLPIKMLIVLEKFSGSEYVLEHHSDVIFNENSEEGRSQWIALSQRWQDVPVI